MNDQPAAPADPAEQSTSGAAKPVIDQHLTASPTVPFVDRRRWAQDDVTTAADGEKRSDKPAYVEELETRLGEKDDLLREYAAKYKGAAEEFEETRVRVRRELGKDVEREKRRVLAAFLDVIDNLERALNAGQTESADSALLRGVEMVRQQFLTVLTEHGVSQIEAAGQPFDPTLHHAVTAVPVADASQDNVVLTVLKPGYRVRDDILRPASVAVGRHEPS